MRIAHVITSLMQGGAQTVLCHLLKGLLSAGHECLVVCLRGEDAFSARVTSLGVSVVHLNMKPGFPSWGSIRLLRHTLHDYGPDVAQTWMYHADLLGGLAAMSARIPVCWGIHHSDLDAKRDKRLTRSVARVNALLSYILPVSIVCCGYKVKRIHEESGFAARKLRVVPNGFDLNHFCPDAESRRLFRDALGISQETVLVGAIGRYHPMKDYPNLIEAASQVVCGRRDIRFLLCGEGLDPSNLTLVELIRRAGLKSHMYLLGRSDNMRAVLNGLDLLVSSSRTEGFPMAIGEAMACSVPCVVTDVGDCALLVGQTGRIVDRENPHALAEAIRELSDLGQSTLHERGVAARERIRKKFALERMVQGYLQIYENAIA